jgi:hypothetical protein
MRPHTRRKPQKEQHTLSPQSSSGSPEARVYVKLGRLSILMSSSYLGSGPISSPHLQNAAG